MCVLQLFFDTRVECIKLAYFSVFSSYSILRFPLFYDYIFISFHFISFFYGEDISLFTCCYPLVWLLNRVTEHNLFFYFNKIVVILLIFLSFISFIFSTDLFSASLSSPLLFVSDTKVAISQIYCFF